MNNTLIYERVGIRYLCDTIEEPDGKYRGKIIVRERRFPLQVFSPAINIKTPATFVKKISAETEARTYAQELIDSGQIDNLLPSQLDNTVV